MLYCVGHASVLSGADLVTASIWSGRCWGLSLTAGGYAVDRDAAGEGFDLA